MLIIDLKTKRVNQAQMDPDVVILKGATTELINNLTRLTLTSGVNVVEANPRKVALGGAYKERISRELPQSVHAQGNGEYQKLLQAFTEMLSPILKTAKKTRATKYSLKTPIKNNTTTVLNNNLKTRAKLQNDIAETLCSDVEFVAALRTNVQRSATLNPNHNFPTTANVKAAIALFAHYSHDRSFSSTVGSSAIAKVAVASPDTIARLSNDFKILRRSGASIATRYFVSNYFANALISTLHTTRFVPLCNVVDALQDQLDSLGSLK